MLLTICWLVEVRSLSTDFRIKIGVSKLPQSFFLVEVGPPSNQSAAFVGRFYNYVSAFTIRFSSAALSSEERLENFVLRLKLSLLMSCRHLLMKKSKEAN